MVSGIKVLSAYNFILALRKLESRKWKWPAGTTVYDNNIKKSSFAASLSFSDGPDETRYIKNHFNEVLKREKVKRMVIV